MDSIVLLLQWFPPNKGMKREPGANPGHYPML